MSPIICAYHELSNTILTGSGGHINLIKNSGFSDSPRNLDKWYYGEIRNLEDGILFENFHVCSEYTVDEDLKVKMFNTAARTIETAEKLIRHIRRNNGFCESLLNLLNQNGLVKFNSKIAVGEDKQETWCSLFGISENRVYTWR
jgi:hypothetical protein